MSDSGARVAVPRIVGRRVFIAVWIVQIAGLIRIVLVRVGIYEESQIVMETSMLEVTASKVPTARGPSVHMAATVEFATSSAAVTFSEAFVAGAPAAHVTAVESTRSGAAMASSEARRSDTRSRRKED